MYNGKGGCIVGRIPTNSVVLSSTLSRGSGIKPQAMPLAWVAVNPYKVHATLIQTAIAIGCASWHGDDELVIALDDRGIPLSQCSRDVPSVCELPPAVMQVAGEPQALTRDNTK